MSIYPSVTVFDTIMYILSTCLGTSKKTQVYYPEGEYKLYGSIYRTHLAKRNDVTTGNGTCVRVCVDLLTRECVARHCQKSSVDCAID